MKKRRGQVSTFNIPLQKTDKQEDPFILEEFSSYLQEMIIIEK